jgi:Fe-S-cluster containining protein
MEKFKCSPFREPFCCLTERISFTPAEIRKFKEVLNTEMILVPQFKGFVKGEFFNRVMQRARRKGVLEYLLNSVSLIPLSEKVYGVLILEVNSLKKYPKPLSPLLRENIKRRFNWEETPVCPFLNIETFKCEIYDERPFSCRLFPLIVAKKKFDKTLCEVCSGGKAFCENCEGLSPSELENSLDTAWLEKEVKEYHSLIRSAFSHSEILSEAIKIFENGNRIVPLFKDVYYFLPRLTVFVYKYFGLSIDKQVEALKSAYYSFNCPQRKKEIGVHLHNFLYLQRIQNEDFGKRMPKIILESKLKKVASLNVI